MNTATTYSPLRAEARRLIRRVIDDHVLGFAENLHAGDVLELRAKLREFYPFGERKYWPYKVWCEEVRRALALPVSPRNCGVRRKKIKTIHVMPAMREWARLRGILEEAI